MFFQFGSKIGGDILDRDTGCVRRDDASGSDDLLDFGKELLFDLQVLDNDFDDPVDIGQPAEIVLKISRPDHGGIFFRIKTGGL